jgi:hypothetical protein
VRARVRNCAWKHPNLGDECAAGKYVGSLAMTGTATFILRSSHESRQIVSR